MGRGDGAGPAPHIARHLLAEVECPFCGETGYDLNGLKGHLQGSCEIYDATSSIHAMTNEELQAGAEAQREFRDSPAAGERAMAGRAGCGR